MPSATDDQRQQRRRQILSVAKRVFAENGYHSASISQIIARANIARGTFYLYFSSKQAVFDSILDEAVSELRSLIVRIDIEDPQAAPPQVQLRENLMQILAYVLDDRHLTQLVLNHNHDPQSEVAERVQTFMTEVVDMLTSSLQHGIDMKLVRPCDTTLVAWALLGAARGVIEHCLDIDPQPPVATIADELIAFSMRGVFVG